MLTIECWNVPAPAGLHHATPLTVALSDAVQELDPEFGAVELPPHATRDSKQMDERVRIGCIV
jgi:hypothetical protein